MASGSYILGPEVDRLRGRVRRLLRSPPRDRRRQRPRRAAADPARLRDRPGRRGDRPVEHVHRDLARACRRPARRPVPVEPDPATHNITAAAVEAAITPATRAIMPVHLYGQPADMDAIVALGRERGIPVDRGRRAGAGRALPRPPRRRPRRRRRLLLLSGQEPRGAGRRGRGHDRRRRARRARAHAAQLRVEGEVPPRRPGPQQPARLAPGRLPARQAAPPGRVERAPARRGGALPRAARRRRRTRRCLSWPSGPSRSGTCSSCATRGATSCRRGSARPASTRSSTTRSRRTSPAPTRDGVRATSRCRSPSGSPTRCSRCRWARTCRSRTPTASRRGRAQRGRRR